MAHRNERNTIIRICNTFLYMYYVYAYTCMCTYKVFVGGGYDTLFIHT